MKHRAAWLPAAFLLIASVSASYAGTLDPGLEAQLDVLSPGESITALVLMESQAPVDELSRDLTRRGASRAERHETVVRALQDMAPTQSDLIEWLDDALRAGEVDGFTTYWLVNAIVVRGKPDAIRRIAMRDDVRLVDRNPKARLVEPVGQRTGNGGLRGIGVTPGLRAIQADRVWYELGITGRGRLLANIDTGVDGYHPAFMERWRGNDGHPWQECWLDVLWEGESTYPEDSSDHGTHVLGTMTGLGAATEDTVGVAWAAQWIACNAIGQGVGEELDNDLLNAFQWLTDPDGDPGTLDDVPDVCQNSWGVHEDFPGYDNCDDRWWDAIDNCEAAGVALFFSAGNEGPDSMSIGSPGDRTTTPYNTFAVGAVDATNNDWPYPIADFSSIGPSWCEGNLTKPEMSAPGVEVYSSVPGGGYDQEHWDGTSMAGPHVAGIAALMREANPDIEVDVIKQIIMDTARDLGDPGEDNIFGWGFPDAYAAVSIALEGTGILEGEIDNATNGGTPVKGARVHLVGSAAAFPTDAAGYYTGHAIAGTYMAIARHPSYLPDSAEVTIDIDSVSMQDFTLVDIAGPEISDVSDPRTIPDETGPYPISAVVVDESEITQVTIHYRVNNGGWLETSMEAERGVYTGGIPGRPSGCTVDFYIEAIDVGDNTRTFPSDAPASYTTFLITSPVLVDDAEDDQGWSLGWVGDDATQGFWIREDPVGTFVGAQPGQPEDDHTADPGHICFVTANGDSGGAPGGADVDGGCTSLVSPVFDPVPAQAAYLYYWRWFGQFGLAGDTYTAQISNNGGGTWHDLEHLEENVNEWTEVFLRIDDYVPLTTNMRLRFTLCDVGYDSTIEGAIDDVSIQRFPLEPQSVEDVDAALRTFLSPPAPNPSHAQTKIAFRLATPGEARLDIYDASGRRIRSLLNEDLSAGLHEVTWDGLDDRGRPVVQGIYFYKLHTGGFEQSSRVSLVR